VAVLDCDDPVATDTSVPATYEQLTGALALPTSSAAPQALQTRPSSERLGLFAKTGLLIHAGAAFTITPAPGWRDQAGAWWGNTGERSVEPSFHGGPCEGTGWLAFPGGFYVAEPGCVPFDVAVAGTTTRVEIGIGAACHGQQPPDGQPTG
jgi:hypothetical protein